MKHSKFKKMGKKQSGFTLIELLMVVVILGILAYVSMSAFSGSPNAANATAIRGGATEIAKGIGYINANLGNGIRSTTLNPLTATGPTMLDVLIIGGVAVNSDAVMKKNFDALSMRPLESEFRVVTRGTATTAGKYTLLSYPVSVVDNGWCATGRVCVQFDNVPKPVVDELLTRYGLTEVAAKHDPANQTVPVTFAKMTTGDMHSVYFSLIP